MTPLRKRSLELARLLLEDAAADTSLPGGNRERFLMMAARILLELEAIEGVASSAPEKQTITISQARESALETYAKAELQRKASYQAAPPKPLEASACSGKFSNHRWLNSPICRRCGAKRYATA